MWQAQRGSILRTGRLRRQDLTSRMLSLALVIAVGTAGAWSPLKAQDAVVARINGTEIHQSDIALIAADLAAAVPQTLSEAEKRDYYISYVADLILMDKAAEQQGITATADYKQRLAMARLKLSAQSLMDGVAKMASTPEELNKAYPEVVKQGTNVDEVRARQIVVRTLQEANGIIQELNEGKDFAELAKAKSIEPDASQGGDLGYFTKDKLAPELADAVFKIAKGQLSAPIKTDRGWHVVKIEDRRKQPVGSLDEMKDQLRLYLVRKAQVELMTKLRGTAKAELVK